MTIDQLVLHPRARASLQSIETNPPHASLLTGPSGVGLKTIAKVLASSGQLQSLLEPVKKSTGEVDELTGTISVASIRQLYELLRSKQPGRRFIIIDNAERLSLGAQSAFLKLLEEPVPGVHFILTSHYPDQILTTVRSRAQAIAVPLADAVAMQKLEISLGLDETALRQLKYVASGRPALMKRLIAEPDSFENLKLVISDALSLLGGDNYQRYVIAYKYGASAAKALEMIDTLILVLKTSLHRTPSARQVDLLDKLARSEMLIGRGVNPRLQLIGCML